VPLRDPCSENRTDSPQKAGICLFELVSLYLYQDFFCIFYSLM
jgi:hypothetical protein